VVEARLRASLKLQISDKISAWYGLKFAFGKVFLYAEMITAKESKPNLFLSTIQEIVATSNLFCL
jgi:hypothetical protein